MKSLWDDNVASEFTDSPLDMRVYTSRLLGRESSLVLHGGGNTSVKASATNLFGETEQLLYVKGSGWDLATIEAEGFAPVRLDVLQKMAELETLSDSEMVSVQRSAMTNPSAPNPSVEAILHAIIPFDFVDHTHADAVVTISNTADGEARIREIYSERVLIVPYVMPGFILAKTIRELTREINWAELDGIIQGRAVLRIILFVKCPQADSRSYLVGVAIGPGPGLLTYSFNDIFDLLHVDGVGFSEAGEIASRALKNADA